MRGFFALLRMTRFGAELLDLFVIAGEAGVGFVKGAVLHGDAAFGHLVELELEVEEQAGFVEFVALESDEDLVVVAVRVLTLATIVAEVVAGGEAGFYGYFEHDSGIP